MKNRDKILSVRVKHDEYERLEDLAGKEGISKYVRNRILGGTEYDGDKGLARKVIGDLRERGVSENTGETLFNEKMIEKEFGEGKVIDELNMRKMVTAKDSGLRWCNRCVGIRQFRDNKCLSCN